MKHKKCLSAFAFLIFLFSVSCLGSVLPDLTNLEVITEEEGNSGISSAGLQTLSDIISVKALYRDSEGFAKALVFEQNEALTDLQVQTEGVSHIIMSAPNSSGLVCEYFDEDIEIGEEAELIFITEDDSYSLSVQSVDIVTTDEEWEINGNTLIAYKGAGGSVTVPNFYNDTVIMSLGGNISYDEDGSSVSYINILGDSTDREITDITISEGILNIYSYAFLNMTALKSVSLPDTLENIYNRSFACTGITSIDFPEKLKTIDELAFYSCENLSGDITIPSGVTSVGRAAFYDCPNTTGTLTLSEGVEEIGELAFGSSGYSVSPSVFEGFTAVVLPSTLKKIGSYAFQYCTHIKTLTLPEGLEVISDGAFDHMSGLTDTSVTIPSTVTTIGGDYGVEENTGYGGHVFYDMGKDEYFTEFITEKGNKNFKAKDGVLYSADITRMIGYPRGKRDTAFEIPEGITLIDELAFSRAAYLETVTLPDSYIITTDIPENILNKDNGNSLAIALYLYTAVKDVEVKETNPNYCSNKGIVYSKDMKTLWYVPSAYEEDIAVAEGCEMMESGSIFTKNSSKVKISIPSSVYDINENAFDFLNDYFTGLIEVNESSIYYRVNDEGEIEEISYTAGDVNEDGKIDAQDAELILKCAANISVKGTCNKKAADFNGDGVINLLDSIAILS